MSMVIQKVYKNAKQFTNMTTLTTKLKLNEYNATYLTMMSDIRQRANPISEQILLSLYIKISLSGSVSQFGIIGV